MTCPQTSPALGAYVLGVLDPEERRWFEHHLDVCPVCAAELVEFAALPELLDQVDPEDLEPVPVTPSPGLFARVSAAADVERTRRSRARRWVLVAAVLLAVLGAGTGVFVWATGSDAEAVTATAGPVWASVVATERANGSVLDVRVAGLRPGETCRIVAIDEDGGRHSAGEWPASPRGDGQWRGWADVERGALDEVHLYGDGGRELVVLLF